MSDDDGGDEVEIEIDDRITEDGDDRITEDADDRTTEDGDDRTPESHGRERPRANAGGTSGPSAGARAAGPLADELGRIDVMTTPEGFVECRIADLREVDERTVRLDVRLPHGRIVSFDLAKPIPWSRSFHLVRIVEDVGYDAASIEHVVGEPVYLARTDAGESETPSWWTASARDVGFAVLSHVGDRFDLDVDRRPRWRLVDPDERPDESARATRTAVRRPLAAAVAFAGALVAAFGAAYGATGALGLSAVALAYAAPGLVLVTIAVLALAGSE